MGTTFGAHSFSQTLCRGENSYVTIKKKPAKERIMLINICHVPGYTAVNFNVDERIGLHAVPTAR